MRSPHRMVDGVCGRARADELPCVEQRERAARILVALGNDQLTVRAGRLWWRP